MKNPHRLFQAVKQTKNQSNIKINELNVGSTVYTGDSVADGFFHTVVCHL